MTAQRHARQATPSGRWQTAVVGSALVLGICAAPTSAFAQSSLTLYGVVDEGMVYASNQKGRSNLYMLQGMLNSSRWGLIGSEQLSSTTKAIFKLEAGFNPSNGAASSSGLEFNRQAWVGLTGKRMGTLQLGRQYSPWWTFFNGLGPVPSLTGASGAHAGDIDGLDTTIRVNNSVVYTSPTIAGVTASVQYGFGGVPGSLESGSEYSGAVRYAGGPLTIAAAYLRYNNTQNSDGFNSTTGTSVGVSSLNTGYITAHDVAHAGILANYTIGNVLLGVSYTNVAYRPDADSLFHDTAVFNTYGGFARYAPIPNLFFAAGYSYTTASEANGVHDAASYHQIALMESYDFSKETVLYFLESWQHANGQTLGADGAGDILDATASIGDSQNSTPSSGRNQMMLGMGLSVKF